MIPVMCTSPITSFTKSRFIPKFYASRFQVHFPCCMCADCMRKKKSEYSLRAYYHAKQCFDNGGYVLFDTLTYRDSSLRYFHDIYKPALYNSWDFPAFSRSDVKKFFKRLRTNLTRLGYDVKDNLSTFLTSEYGSRPDRTHRPHYHVLFFVNVPELDPETLSRQISLAWHHGITDGLCPEISKPKSNCTSDAKLQRWYNFVHERKYYKPLTYVLHKRVFFGSNSDSLRCFRYVAKYVTKDMYSYKKLFNRVYQCFSIANPDWQKNYKKRLEFRRFRNQVLPFHLQSVGFGLAALKYEDQDYILKNNAIRMPVSSKGVTASIPLPQYLGRKLMYECVLFNGKLRWQLKPEYVPFKVSLVCDNIRRFALTLSSFFADPKIDTMALAEYDMVWRGSLIPKFMLHWSTLDIIKDLYDPSRNRLLQMYRNHDLLFNYNSERDGAFRYVSSAYVPDVDCFRAPEPFHCWTHQEFINSPSDDLVFVDSSLEKFAGFDDLLEDYYDSVRLNGMMADRDAAERDRLLDRYKEIGFVDV